MANKFSQPPLFRPVAPSNSKAALTPAERRTMKFVDASVPPQSPTRIAVLVTTDEPQSPAAAKKLREEICEEYQAKHGRLPDLEYVMSEVFKRRGIKLPKRAFK